MSLNVYRKEHCPNDVTDQRIVGLSILKVGLMPNAPSVTNETVRVGLMITQGE